MLIYLIITGYFAAVSAILWQWIGPNFWTFLLVGIAAVILLLGYYQARRDERKGDFKLFIVGVDEIYLSEAWGIAKERAREEGGRHNTVFLFEKIDGKFSRVDFSRCSEFKKIIKEVFGRR